MGWMDFKNLVPIHNFAVPAAATSVELELSTLLNKVAGANSMVRAIVIAFTGSITTGTGADGEYWIDEIDNKLTRIRLLNNGETVWDIGARNALLLQKFRLGICNYFNQTFAASTQYWINQELRFPFLDDAFCRAKDDGLVPARALHDATLQLQFAASSAAYPWTAMTCRIFAELVPMVGEYRKNWIMERISDTQRKADDDFIQSGRRIYNRMYLVYAPSRTTGIANWYNDTVITVRGDNVFVDHMRGDELRLDHLQTNPQFGENENVYVAADKPTDIGENLYCPILWPHRDGWQGEMLSKQYSCYYKRLEVHFDVTTLTPTAPHPLLMTWIPVENENELAQKAASVGLANYGAKARTASKKALTQDPSGMVAAKVLPNKVK